VAVAVAEDDELIVGEMLAGDEAIKNVDLAVSFELGAYGGVLVGDGGLTLAGGVEGSGAEKQVAVLAHSLEGGDDFGIVELVEGGVDLDAVAGGLLQEA
jgi:hypothetical protein